MWQSCGHLDFYPNGGRIMAGCEKGIMNHIAGMCVEFGFFFQLFVYIFQFYFSRRKRKFSLCFEKNPELQSY